MNKKELNEVWEKITQIYDKTVETNPKSTAERVIREIGSDDAKEAMALAITIKAWDGRISDGNKKYWTALGKEYGFTENMSLSKIDAIHPAHLDQIAEEMKKILQSNTQEKEQAESIETDNFSEQSKRFPIEVNVIGAELSDKEIMAYIDYAQKKCRGNVLKGIDIKVDGNFVDLSYRFKDLPFERIRRITGYLVGTLDRFNDAKKAEVKDRVKHSLASEDESDIYLDKNEKQL